MKFYIAFSVVLAVASAAPLAETETQPTYLLEKSPIGRQQIGGLSLPSAWASTINTGAGPINFGNVNKGTGLQPSQIVHYGTENQPHQGYIAPKVIETTAKEAMFQVTKAEKADDLINVNMDVGKLAWTGRYSKHAATNDEDEDDEDENSKWAPYPWGYPPYWRHRHHWRWWRRHRHYPPWWY
ncbi:hypothetical protein BX616_007923 [Lobosporangium transversale]|uniref:Uncharacterized protein n=1 Tax=Lobosporangium transversale TaxID=64571 RepID=A0A1Y2H307_9FUNG|nr:hypothetical protein BCR41DRAFT_366614 [Lobosporangium transversale]KAF9914612.1 hypothetical protein BX616_007923 [Lobosporangium transversale]ORZ28928.1 hypothetical protein BCR41DRAFT_366614 [Lobosporangium transversale]|eukprot:XP_021886601.1 hypothetical protein BCR41DRAFT_366614 [Lobosporangium transversale]